MGLKKFRNFKEAGEDVLIGFYQNSFDPVRARLFFSNFTGRTKNFYNPGLYKFKSFSDAREYDLKKIIENSATERSNK